MQSSAVVSQPWAARVPPSHLLSGTATAITATADGPPSLHFPCTAPLRSAFLGHTFFPVPIRRRSCHPSSPSPLAVSAASSSGPAETKEPEEYTVELEKPIGIKFYKGSDGGVYIDSLIPGGSADKTKMFTPGDKVLATSAVFGTEIWPAAEYGRTMYTIRQRIGTLEMRMQKRYGQREDTAVPKDVVAAQRNANSLGDAVREIQVQNYLRKMEMKKQREADLDEGLKLYKVAKYEEALDKFESVLGLKPEPREEAVASYNVACCYSKINQVEAGLSALGDAMEAGFEDYKKIRTDPDLETLRASPSFKALMDKYDEPFINENAINAFKSVFGFLNKN